MSFHPASGAEHGVVANVLVRLSDSNSGAETARESCKSVLPIDLNHDPIVGSCI